MTEIDELIARIEAVPGCQHTKRLVIQVLASMTGRRICFARRALLLPTRVRLAADLLEGQHMTTAEAANVLMERLGVSRRTAQRLVWRARHDRQRRNQVQQAAAQMGLEW